MDQIDDSKYPSPPSNYSVSSTLFYTGAILFMASPINYLLLRNAEQAMIITAYSFFFFLGSGITSLCSSHEEHDEDNNE